jgi:putative glutamine amidotransferase
MSAKKPRILVIPDWEKQSQERDNQDDIFFLRRNYLQALETAGAMPFVVGYDLANVHPYLDMAQGLMIIGGGFTIDPELFNQPMRSQLPLKPERTKVEWAYCQEALRRKMPILGICGGMQLINVVLGGELIQHLPDHPDVLDHSAGHELAHEVRLVPTSALFGLLGGPLNFYINSSHKQAVGRLGRGLQVNALAEDGVIEGLELMAPEDSTPGMFCMGVQWHPEYLHTPQDRGLFDAFVTACNAFAKKI